MKAGFMRSARHLCYNHMR